MNFLQAVAREEGFYASGSRPQRNLNPGDLEYHPWMIPYKATLEPAPKNGKPARFAKFPTADDGFACMLALFHHPAVFKGEGAGRRLVTGYLGATVEEGLNEWAPAGENEPSIYIARVCLWANCKPDDLIEMLINLPLS